MRGIKIPYLNVLDEVPNTYIVVGQQGQKIFYLFTNYGDSTNDRDILVVSVDEEEMQHFALIMQNHFGRNWNVTIALPRFGDLFWNEVFMASQFPDHSKESLNEQRRAYQLYFKVPYTPHDSALLR